MHIIVYKYVPKSLSRPRSCVKKIIVEHALIETPPKNVSIAEALMIFTLLIPDKKWCVSPLRDY